MKPSLNYIQNILRDNSKLLSEKKITAGFDGFVDSVIRVIRTKPEGNDPGYFQTIKEFGEYIVEKEGGSFSIEVEELFQKLGGNMPILSNALAQFGVTVNCIGAFGDQTIHTVFKSMHSGCRQYSFASPGITSALEFNDGKILLGQMKDLNLANWEVIKSKIGLEKLLGLYEASDLFCFVNWGELDCSTDIWQGILADVMPYIKTFKKTKKIFFDLSDSSKRSDASVKEALRLIESFNAMAEVTLSLNKNESQQVHTTLTGTERVEDLELLGKEIFDSIQIENLIIHTSTEAYGWNETSFFKTAGYSIQDPKIFTGAGDNFNAGICLGLLLDLELGDSLSVGNAIAACYISNGKSPTINDLTLNNSLQ